VVDVVATDEVGGAAAAVVGAVGAVVAACATLTAAGALAADDAEVGRTGLPMTDGSNGDTQAASNKQAATPKLSLRIRLFLMGGFLLGLDGIKNKN